MKKNIVKELNEMKYLFGYERGRVISEQKEVPMEEDVDFDVMNDEDIDFDVESNREIETPVRPDVDTPTKPKNPDTPYSPKPGPKKKPKAENERRMPSWLSFDELGIDMSEN
jgi:hypothetical protein